MKTNAETAADLLQEASNFFHKLAEGNPPVKAQMMENCKTFIQVSQLIRSNPTGRIDHLTHAEMAARLLREAAQFFRSIGETNLPIQEQMDHNASVYDEMANRVTEDPLKILES